MAIRTILTEGDPKLTKVCHPVTKFDQKLADLLDDMVETLEASAASAWPRPRSAPAPRRCRRDRRGIS